MSYGRSLENYRRVGEDVGDEGDKEEKLMTVD
jgi:hypothetical protein